MKIISESIIKSNSGATFAVKKGQIIRVMGHSTADYTVFNLHNVKERFDQARTKVDQGKIYVSTGDVLISKFNNVMQTIVKDTYKGSHDMEKGMCSTSFYKKWGEEIFKIYGGVWKKLGRKKSRRAQAWLLGESCQGAQAPRRGERRCAEPAQRVSNHGDQRQDRQHALLDDPAAAGRR